MLVKLTESYENAVKTVVEANNSEYADFMARRLVEMAGVIIMSYLLLADATKNDSFVKSAEVYAKLAQAEVAKHADFIANFNPSQVEAYKA